MRSTRVANSPRVPREERLDRALLRKLSALPHDDSSYSGEKWHQGLHKFSHCCLLLRLATRRPGILHRAAAPASARAAALATD